jgi:peptide-methionine (S)-S-oxide reductase
MKPPPRGIQERSVTMSKRAFASPVFLLLLAFGTLRSRSAPAAEPLAKATFAGGCFWCMQPPFDKTPGVVSTAAGYTGGTARNPSYEEVSGGGTGHAESVEVTYDPRKVTYETLLDVYWHNVDPFDTTGQFCDHGTQYRTAIFTHDETQRRLAEESKKALEKRFSRPIATQVVPAAEFWAAEGYHQQYYLKNPLRYKIYRLGCGRDHRLEEIWGKAAGGH